MSSGISAKKFSAAVEKIIDLKTSAFLKTAYPLVKQNSETCSEVASLDLFLIQVSPMEPF